MTVAAAWKRMAELGSFKLDVFACHALDVPYHDFCLAYLAACDRVRSEFGSIPPVAGLFGKRELISADSFVKTFYPPRGTAEGVIAGRVEFRLADDTRAAFEAAITK